MPRCVEGSSLEPKSQRGSQIPPKKAKAKKIARHPHKPRIMEARGNAIIAPRAPPLQLKPAAREYSWRGNQRTRIPLTEGYIPLSPAPMIIRIRVIPESDLGRGVRAVNRDHQA